MYSCSNFESPSTFFIAVVVPYLTRSTKFGKHSESFAKWANLSDLCKNLPTHDACLYTWTKLNKLDAKFIYLVHKTRPRFCANKRQADSVEDIVSMVVPRRKNGNSFLTEENFSVLHCCVFLFFFPFFQNQLSPCNYLICQDAVSIMYLNWHIS